MHHHLLLLHPLHRPYSAQFPYSGVIEWCMEKHTVTAPNAAFVNIHPPIRRPPQPPRHPQPPGHPQVFLFLFLFFLYGDISLVSTVADVLTNRREELNDDIILSVGCFARAAVTFLGGGRRRDAPTPWRPNSAPADKSVNWLSGIAASYSPFNLEGFFGCFRFSGVFRFKWIANYLNCRVFSDVTTAMFWRQTLWKNFDI